MGNERKEEEMTARTPKRKRNWTLLSSRAAFRDVLCQSAFQGGSGSASELPAGNDGGWLVYRGERNFPLGLWNRLGGQSPLSTRYRVVSGWAVFSRAAEMASKAEAVDFYSCHLAVLSPSLGGIPIPGYSLLLISPLDHGLCGLLLSQPNCPSLALAIVLRRAAFSCTDERAG